MTTRRHLVTAPRKPAQPADLLVIDPGVPAAASLLSSADRACTTLVLPAGSDPLAAIRATLLAEPGIGVLHLLSHGRAGEIQLHGQFRGAQWLLAEREAWAEIGRLLGPGGEIALYGCGVAAGESGRQFLETLEILSGVAVHASSTPVGASELGGDWVLDRRGFPGVGAPRPLPVSEAALQQYRGLLEDPLFGEEQVNTVTAGRQQLPQVVALVGGGYVVVWQGPNRDGDGLSVSAQIFTGAGVPVGSEILVNSNFLSNQQEPAVAATADGGFVIAWEDDSGVDGSGSGVFAQRYDADGLGVGGEFQVNTFNSSTQSQVAVAGLTGGGFVAVYRSNGVDGSSYGVAMQRYDAAGAPQGSETVVNTSTGGDQMEPRVAALPGGGYLVTWTDRGGSDGDSYGVIGQRFDATGNPVGGEIVINQTTTGAQDESSVSVFSDGSFVVVWKDWSGQDGSGYGVYARLFNADGSPQGNELLVNGNTAGNQYQPDVLALPDGSFVVAWYDDNQNDVLKREFDSSGNPVEEEQLVGAGTDWQPRIVDLGNGNYSVVYNDWAGTDGSDYGIFQQLFGDPAEITRPANPELDAINGSVVYAENLLNSAPQLIDANGAVSLSDADSSDFDGGILLVSYLVDSLLAVQQFEHPDNLGQHQLGIADAGVGPGQIGLTGASVTYGGVVIGTVLSDGADGAELRIQLNASATIPAVETLVESLTYQNLSGDPVELVRLAISLTDGDGGSTGSIPVDITITPEVDGAVKVFTEEQANSFTAGDQDESAVGALSGGGYVIAWTSASQDSSGNGIYAQRYDANGVLVGPEFLVNSTVSGNQSLPAVTGLSGGDFVITWHDDSGADGSGVGVYGQRFDATGNPLGSEFQINTTSSSTQRDSAVAALDDGGFVVTWTDRGGADGSSYGVFGQRYDSAGVAQGSEFQVNTFTSSVQYQSHVVGLAGGGFAVVWASFGQDAASTYGVFGQRYDSAGVEQGGEFQVNTHTTSTQEAPRVAALTDGGMVVVWRSDGAQDGSGSGIFGQRFDAAGNPVGGEFRVNENTGSSQTQPDVVALDTGGFVVSWTDESGRDGSSWGLFAQEYDALGHRVDGEFQVNTEFSSTQYQGSLAALPGGNFVAAWSAFTSAGSGDGSGYGVFHQLFGDPLDFNPQASPEIGSFSTEANYQENTVNSTPQLLDVDSEVALSDADSTHFDGGTVLVSLLSNPEPLLDQFQPPDDQTQDQLGVRNEGVAFGQIGVSGNDVTYSGNVIGSFVTDGTDGTILEIALNANASVDAVEALLENLTYANTSDDPSPTRQFRIQVSDGAGGVSDPHVITVNVLAEEEGVVPVFTEEQANSFTAGDQDESAVGALSGGGYVIAWTSAGQDSSGNGIYAQRYDANGVLVGPEFLVNSTVSGNQSLPAVTGLSGGDFVITWDDDSGADGSGVGVYGQRFDATGNPLGSEFLINTTTSSTQRDSSVAALDDGGFVVTWTDRGGADGSSYGVFGQRYDSAGVAQGGEFQVNTFTSSVQYQSHVVGLAGGGFAVVWASFGQDAASTYGVFAQRYDSAGVEQGGEFQVNTHTTSTQEAPRVAALTDGGMVVVWRSDGAQDSSGSGIFGQRFDAAGNAVGGEFRVNESTGSSQNQPDVIALDTGGFVVSWTDESGRDGSSWGTYAQEYDALGHRVDGEFQVNTEFSSVQYQGALAPLPGGNFVAAWSAFTSGGSGDGDGYGVFQQLFGDPADFTPVASPEIEGFSPEVTYQENLVNLLFQALDSDTTVALSDADSTVFDGGSLLVSRAFIPDPLRNQYQAPDDLTQDQLGVWDEGTGVGQIGVSGSDITYEGLIIGTIDAGNDGADGNALEISLNSNATVEAVESLLDHLTYRNSSDDPLASRQYRVQVSDGSGGTSDAHLITVNVEAEGEPGAAVVVGSEEQVNSYFAGDQDESAVGALSGGGYVIAWTSAGQDSSGNGIYAQRYDANGVLVGPEFLVNSTVSGNQSLPAVTGLSGGDFVITWDDDSGADGSGVGVYGQRFDATGNPLGSEFQINTTSFSTQRDSSVAALDDGGFVVTWTDRGGADGSSYGVFGQRYDSAGVAQGGEFQVNTFTSSVQYQSHVVGLAGGGFAVVWASFGQDAASTYGVFAQRYDSAGVEQGGEFQVNTHTTSTQEAPRVAALTDGGMVVVWRSDGAQDSSGSGIFGQRFDAAGNAVGGEFRVNENTGSSQNQPDVIALDTGGFVVSWTDESGRDGSSWGTYAQEYDALGHRVDGEFQVNTEFSSVQYQGALAPLPGGNFVAAWSAFTSAGSGEGDGYGVFQQLFGDPADFPVQQSPGLTDFGPDVTLLTADVIAAPQIIDDSVYLTDSDSADLDGGFLRVYYVASNTPFDGTDQLGINNQGTGAGEIGVSGSSVTYGGVTIGTISVADDGVNDQPLQIDFNSSATPAAVQALVQNLTYQSLNPSPDGLSRTIAAVVNDGDGGSTRSAAVTISVADSQSLPTIELEDVRASVNVVENDLQASPILVDPQVQFSDHSSPGFDGGEVRLSYDSSQSTPTSQLTVRDQGAGPGQIGLSGANVTYGGVVIGTIDGTDNGVNGADLTIALNASADEEAIEVLLENLSFQNTSDLPPASQNLELQVEDGSGNSTATRDILVVIEPVEEAPEAIGGEQQVNSFITGAQELPAMATLSTGGYVIVWESDNQDGGGEGVFGQRFDGNGVMVGPEFLVNTTLLGEQQRPKVAALNGGEFVVSWDDGSRIYVQRFNADGNPVGDEIQVNTLVASTQWDSSVVGLNDGSFVVAWSAFASGASGDGSGYGIVAQRYDATGNPLGGNFIVNTTTSGYQQQPRMASLDDGGFVVVWDDGLTSGTGDGSGAGVSGQRYDAAGNEVGSEFQVNTETSGNQDTPVVAGLVGGGFVVAWESAGQDGGGDGIYAQRFDAAGNPVDSEFRVNETTSSDQTIPEITALANGGFVITWQGNGTGDSSGVFGQQYDSGSNRVGEEFKLNTATSSTQAGAAVTSLTNGNFVTAWYSATSGSAGDGSSNGVFQQIFGNPADFNTQVAPGLSGLNSDISYGENAVNATPALLDANGSVGLSDPDSANFDGGSLLVSRLSNPQPLINQFNVPDDLTQDQLGVRNEGNGAGQIGVAGGNISYGGNLIGTIDATQDGVDGAAWKSISMPAPPPPPWKRWWKLTYGNSSDNPLPARQFRVQVSDGDGGASEPRLVTVNITQELTVLSPSSVRPRSTVLSPALRTCRPSPPSAPVVT